METASINQLALKENYRKADQLLLTYLYFMVPFTIGSGLYYHFILVGFIGTTAYTAIFFITYYFIEDRGLKRYGFFIAMFLALYILMFVSNGDVAINYYYYITLGLFTFYTDLTLLALASGYAFVHYLVGYEGLSEKFPLLQNYTDYFIKKGGLSLGELIYTELAILASLLIFGSMAKKLKVEMVENQRKDKLSDAIALQLEKDEAFAKAIARGDLNQQVEIDPEDTLGKALLEMKKSIVESKKKEDNERFITQGIEKINSTLRFQNLSLEESCDLILKEVIHYLGAVQGIIFLKQEDQKREHLVAMSKFAYGGKKFVDKHILPGEGLAGQIYLEGASQYITDIPNSYPSVQSGLGEDQPISLYLCPLIFNHEKAGIMELAFFHEIEEYEQRFIDKASENIASALLNQLRSHQTLAKIQENNKENEHALEKERSLRQRIVELERLNEEQALESERKIAVLETQLNLLQKTQEV